MLIPLVEEEEAELQELQVDIRTAKTSLSQLR